MSKEFTFNGQRPDEAVEEIIKNHPFVLFLPGLKAILLLAIPTATLIFFGASLVFTLTTLICVPLALGVFSRAYYIYSVSVLLITNQRVLHLDQRNFFKKRIVETNLDKIQDVSSDMEGPIKTALGFGNLEIRTAGASSGTEIIIKNIPNPYQAQQEITKRIE